MAALFDGIPGLGNLQQIMQFGQQMQGRMEELQETLRQAEISASSGGGMVKVVVDGKGDVKSVGIDPAVVDPSDVEMLEDLLLAALSEAQKKARAEAEEEVRKITGGLPMPFKLPGLF